MMFEGDIEQGGAVEEKKNESSDSLLRLEIDELMAKGGGETVSISKAIATSPAQSPLPSLSKVDRRSLKDISERTTADSIEVEATINLAARTNITNQVVTKNGSSNNSVQSSSTSLQKIDQDTDKPAADDHHGHAGPTPVSLLASSVVCFIIYFVFCIVFSSVVWDPLEVARDTTINPPFGIPQGVGINLMGIAVGCVFFAWKSGCKAVMAGPDLLPVVFFAEAGASVMAYLISQQGVPPCDFGDDAAAHRFLGGGGGGEVVDPCSDVYHRHLAGDDVKLFEPELIAQVVPTTLIAMMIGNAITGLLFYGLGKMKNTASVIGFIPASVVAGFLTCIGYKVIKLAVLITTGYAFKEKYIKNIGIDLPHANDPWLPLLIALIYGVLLYGLKRLHVVAAEKLILGFIAVPIVMFFAIVAISDISMQELRENDWFLSQARDGNGCEENCAFTRANFWQTLQVAYGSIDLVAWGAVPRCIPIFIMGATMTSLDSMLKLTSSEKALGIDLDYNHEMKLGGKATIFSSFLAGSPAYGQTKFNVINLSIARTADSPLPTLFLGAICLLVFLSGIAGPIINIMPRFLLGGLCVFAGVGFLYENLWEGRKNMNRVSFGIVWVIFLVNFIWEFFVLQNLPKEIQPMVPGLLVVFILGIVLSTFEFMFAFMHKANPPMIRDGDECCSSAVRSEKHDNQLAVMSAWFQIFSVDSFVFFGTANNLYQQLKHHLANQKVSKPKAERTKYLIFDLEEVTGIDSSAKDVFFKVHRLLKSEGIKLVWAIKKPKLVRKFEGWGLYAGTKQFQSLDLALRHVEDQLLRRATRLSEKWLVDDTVRRIYERQVLANVFNISVRSNEKTFSSVRLQPWAQRVPIAAGEELCGDNDDNLYMLYTGEVQIQGRDGTYSVFTGSFFNIDRMLISLGALPGLPSTLGAVATTDSMVLLVPRKNFVAMSKADGPLAQKLLMTLIVQNESNRPGRVRVRNMRSETSLTQKLDESTVSGSSTGLKSMASRLCQGDDYEISLTDAQVERFGTVFGLIVEDGEEEIPMEYFSSYVSMEARALGSQIEHKQFMGMIDASGIDEDGDGSLSEDEFLSFLRGMFLANIPSGELDALREAYDAAVAEAPDEPMDELRAQVLFGNLGFDVESSDWHDVMGVIDADGDGDVDFSEFLTGIGMMKKNRVLSSQLDTAFRQYKFSASQNRRSLHSSDNITTTQSSEDMSGSLAAPKSRLLQRGTSAMFGARAKSQAKLIVVDDDDDESKGGVELDAGDLEAFLSVSRDFAEEMVFLADQDEVEAVQQGAGGEIKADRTIDRDEFQQLIKSWS
ncbi:hypothetical protein ACHAXR_011169 [Thalassiosira sp. AJA248-18]